MIEPENLTAQKQRTSAWRPLRMLCLAVPFVVAALFVATPAAEANETPAKGYRPLLVPPNWRFESPTPAYNPQDGEKIGDFQPGIRVDVLSADPVADTWLVRYSGYGAAPVEAYIDWPNLSQVYAARWEQIQRELDQAELIKHVLSNETPWVDSLAQVALTYLKGNVKLDAGTARAPDRILVDGKQMGTLWGLSPIFVAVENGPDGTPIIFVEIWNKVDGRWAELQFPGRSVNNAYHLLREKLENLSRQLDGNRLSRNDPTDNTLSLVREQRTAYPLANGTQALLRYQRNEYLIMELRPFAPVLAPSVARNTQASANSDRQPAQSLATRLRSNVTDHKNGYRYIAGIPMINQGDKGYCASATIARVLQYYGYQVDMHQMAYLAANERDGTSYRDMVSAMRRVCNSTPYRFRNIRSREMAELAANSIERGIPLIWLVPGHVRLVIGFSPEKNEVVYTDSWGPGHDFKVMRWGDFVNQTVDIFLLDVGER